MFSVRRSEPSSVFRSTFRVVITSQFDVQSHHHHFQLRRVAFSVSAFRATTYFRFSVLSHFLSSFKRPETCFASFRRSEPLRLRLGVQSHHLPLFRCSEPLHHSFRCLEPLGTYPFRRLELFLSLVSALKAIVLFGIQCRYHLFFSLASKAGVHTHSRILGHHVFLPVDIQSHFSLVVSSRVTTPGICIHWHCAFDFPDSSIHLYLLHPVTPCLPLIHHRLSRFLFIGT